MSYTERLMRVIQAPMVTEKATMLQEKHSYAFRVAKDAEKADIKKAVELMFKVNVLSVKTINMRGKARVFKGIAGFRNSTKKAYVTIPDDQRIEISQA